MDKNSIFMMHSSSVENDLNVEWFVDEFLYFRETVYISGWMFHRQQRVLAVGYALRSQETRQDVYEKLDGYGLPSSDVEQVHGGVASNCRFSCHLHIESAEKAQNIELVFFLDNHRTICIKGFAQRKFSVDPYHLLNRKFFEMLSLKSEGSVLEIGSRNRSGSIRRGLVSANMNYVGMDIKDGENVDVVGDAHALTKLFAPDTFDAIFTMSVFEHLIMPWKVIIEMNRVMRPGGLVLVTTHHTFPLHETPWDFWRFSDQAWHGLFNQFTGFEVLSTAVGEPAAIVASMLHSVTLNMEKNPAYLASAVLCRKTQNTQLNWDVNTEEIIQTVYPN